MAFENPSLYTYKMFRHLKPIEFSNPLLSPSYISLQFWGLIEKKHRKVYIIMHISALVFVITQYIELWIIRNDLKMAIRNLSMTLPSTVTVLKAVTYVYWEKKWSILFDYVSRVEIKQLVTADSKTKTIISEYTTYSRQISSLYRILIIATAFLIVFVPVFSFLNSSQYQEKFRNNTLPFPVIMSSWIPFDKTQGYGYWVMVLEHSLFCCYAGSVLINFDCNTMILISFFSGQLKILSNKCARMFDDHKDLTHEQAMNRIKECHYQHLNLIKFSSLLNSLLSSIMFIYTLVCYLMICASASYWNMKSTANMQRIWIGEYLIAIIVQLFLYCWHSKEMLNTSNTVSDSIYASNWYTQNVRIRRNVLLLSGQLRESIELTAGPFTKLNLATFVTILKGSYSYFALLNQLAE